MKITYEEREAVASLKSLSKRWPKSLWLFSANGTLNVMKKKRGGKRATLPGGGMDPAYVVATIPIENDGGDW